MKEVATLSYFHSLSVFVAVAEENSFSAAAKKLNLTQPTVSFHIDNLEKKLGCPLFIRTVKGVTLTVYGNVLLESAQKLETIASTAENHIRAMAAGTSGHISIGASTIPGEYILPQRIGAFLEQHPGIRISLHVDNTDKILDAYAQGRCSLAIVGARPKEPLSSTPLWQDKLVLAAHPELAGRLPAEPTLADICSLPFLLRESASGTQQAARNVMDELGIDSEKLHIPFQTNGTEAYKTALVQQCGIGFISNLAIKKELADGRLVALPLPIEQPTRTFYGVYDATRAPSCLELFWQFLNHQF